MKLLGLGLILSGIALGVYLGGWVMFIGGIVQIINEGKSVGDVSGFSILAGILKIVFAAAVGWISALVLVFPGMAMINTK